MPFDFNFTEMRQLKHSINIYLGAIELHEANSNRVLNALTNNGNGNLRNRTNLTLDLEFKSSSCLIYFLLFIIWNVESQT